MQARAIVTQIGNRAVGVTRLATAHQVFRPRFDASSTLPTLPSASKALSLRREAFVRVFSISVPMESRRREPSRVIEHIVLLKVKDDVSAELQDAMVSGLRGLKCLPTVIELSVGKIVQPAFEAFTHALHCRYLSKEDLTAYANDPYHLDVVNKYIVPIVEDRLALDWEADVEDPVLQSASYGAVRIVTMKPKPSLDSEHLSSVIDGLRGIKKLVPVIKQVSVGKNFSPARAKDYEWAYLAVLPTPDVLSALNVNKELERLHAQVASAMEKVNVADYYTA
ncbi:hypothetical protein L7F22_068868 [Adiantum nelumboides]|nr:hypothetical protein [Adiantum nelumboides]